MVLCSSWHVQDQDVGISYLGEGKLLVKLLAYSDMFHIVNQQHKSEMGER